MLTLSRLYLRADRRADRPIRDLDPPAESVFKSADSASGKFFPPVEEKGTVVRARVGTVEIIIIITTVASEFFRGIRDYPTFRKGLLAFLDDARECGRAIRSTIVKQRTLEDEEIQASRVTRGHLMQLEQLHRRVAEGDMSPYDAHEKAVDLFRRAGEKVSEQQSQELLASFKDLAKQPRKDVTAPKRALRAPVVRPLRRRVYRRGVQLERKPGEKKISRSVWRSFRA